MQRIKSFSNQISAVIFKSSAVWQLRSPMNSIICSNLHAVTINQVTNMTSPNKKKLPLPALSISHKCDQQTRVLHADASGCRKAWMTRYGSND